ncbi:tRNA (guanine(46)-N(7))-methyltransferase TrmB [Zymobacter palmae]|nr:SAM-dependent methyltransferase [Zymobacter palmae]
MYANSRAITTRQLAPHESLESRLKRMMAAPWQRPYAQHSIAAFAGAERLLQAYQPDFPSGLILDSCCGVGLSTRQLAQAFPSHLVIGVDRSADRLSRDHGPLPGNALLVRADLCDFWRLALEAGWQPERHYLLYPNPYPKAGHLKRRWQGHPVFPTLMALGGRLELRSNWDIYVQEFAQAIAIVTGQPAPEVEPHDPQNQFLTPFEKKYHASGQTLWRCTAELPYRGA